MQCGDFSVLFLPPAFAARDFSASSLLPAIAARGFFDLLLLPAFAGRRCPAGRMRGMPRSLDHARRAAPAAPREACASRPLTPTPLPASGARGFSALLLLPGIAARDFSDAFPSPRRCGMEVLRLFPSPRLCGEKVPGGRMRGMPRSLDHARRAAPAAPREACASPPLTPTPLPAGGARGSAASLPRRRGEGLLGASPSPRHRGKRLLQCFPSSPPLRHGTSPPLPFSPPLRGEGARRADEGPASVMRSCVESGACGTARGLRLAAPHPHPSPCKRGEGLSRFSAPQAGRGASRRFSFSPASRQETSPMLPFLPAIAAWNFSASSLLPAFAGRRCPEGG
jgi:hypothetical protein